MKWDAGVSQWDIPMEIKGPGRVETSAIKRKAPAGAASPGFAVSDTPESHALIVAGPGPIAALDSILILQGLDDSTQGKSKDRKSTRLNSSHTVISYAVFCL